MNVLNLALYRTSRWVIKGGLGFYFTRIERFHGHNVPATGPVLFTSNHPNSLTDPFVIGTSVSRKVNFVATVLLFRWKPLAALLSACGVIPINRTKDNPHAMRSVLDTFEACFRVLEQGEAIGIFPEGITHDDPQVKTVKTGAARMALELEHRHSGQLGLKIVPVGLTFSAKEKYRSEVLVNFGPPICVAEYLPQFEQNRHAGIQALSGRIEHDIKALIGNVAELKRVRIVEAVKRLYLGELVRHNAVIEEPVTPAAGDLLLTQAIVQGIDLTFTQKPERAAEFVRKLDRYEHGLGRLRVSDAMLAASLHQKRLIGRTCAAALIAILGAPIAIYGWLHRLIPAALVQLVVSKTGKQPVDKTHISTARIVSGTVFFTGFYALYIFIFHRYFEVSATVWYTLSLPVSGVVAVYYVRELRELARALHALPILIRRPSLLRRLSALRAELLSMISTEREDLLASGAVLKGNS